MPDPRNHPQSQTIADDIERGEKLLSAKQAAQLPFMPLGRNGNPVSALTINRWMRSGLEYVGVYPRLTTRSAILRFIKKECIKTPPDELAYNRARKSNGFKRKNQESTGSVTK